MVESKDIFNHQISKATISVNDMVDRLYSNEEIKNFITSNDLSSKDIENSINTFLEYLMDKKVNKNNIVESKSIPGFYPTLSYDNKKISIKYKRITPLKKGHNNIKLINLPEQLKTSSFSDFDLTTQDRMKAYTYAKRFIDTFSIPSDNKGMYIAGPFRSGKTYLASIIANEIASKGYNVIAIYYPELSMMLKKSMNNESELSFYDLIDEMKQTDLLILDDFGGEAQNPYIRDEVLGVILNDRMNRNKPVIFTSNIRIQDLLSQSLMKEETEAESIKAQRIIQRIKEISEEFNIYDKYEKKKERNYYEN